MTKIEVHRVFSNTKEQELRDLVGVLGGTAVRHDAASNTIRVEIPVEAENVVKAWLVAQNLPWEYVVVTEAKEKNAGDLRRDRLRSPGWGYDSIKYRETMTTIEIYNVLTATTERRIKEITTALEGTATRQNMDSNIMRVEVPERAVSLLYGWLALYNIPWERVVTTKVKEKLTSTASRERLRYELTETEDWLCDKDLAAILAIARVYKSRQEPH